MFRFPYIAEMYASFDDFELVRELLLGEKKGSPHVTDEDVEAYKYTFSQPGKSSTTLPHLVF